MLRGLVLWTLLIVAGCAGVRSASSETHVVTWSVQIDRLHAVSLASDLERLGGPTALRRDRNMADRVLVITGKVIVVVIVVAAVVAISILLRDGFKPDFGPLLSDSGTSGRSAGDSSTLETWFVLRSGAGSTLAAAMLDNGMASGAWTVPVGDYRLALRMDLSGTGGEWDLGTLTVDGARSVTVQCGSAGRHVAISRP